jgi:hypothetical protein
MMQLMVSLRSTHPMYSKRSHASGLSSISLEAGLDMPQPINRIVSDAHVILNTDAISGRPDFAVIICKIFATWASIEREINTLLIRLLGAKAAPAHAIFSILQTQSLQSKALEAAAKATLDGTSFEASNAFMIVVESVQKTRNRLAHWAWGSCKNRPDLFILADPSMLKERDARTAAHFQSLQPGTLDVAETWNAIQFNDSLIFAYTKADLERELRDLKEADRIALLFSMFLDPSVGVAHAKSLELPESAEQIRALLLDRLKEQRLFREALDRINANRKSTPQQPHG